MMRHLGEMNLRLLITIVFLIGSHSAQLCAETLTMIVMDPLAKPLSCPCVEGYAQRDYEQLGRYLQEKIGRDVDVVFSESLVEALRKNDGKADIVIGKHSVVVSDSDSAALDLCSFASLTDLKGAWTQTGLVVVRSNDPAKSIGDLEGYRVLFGPKECDEKHGAVIEMLRAASISIPDELETSEACSDGACKIIEWGDNERAAAVISSYAKPLLEGCGTVQKGDLRVIGESAPVAFITAFVNEELSADSRAAIEQALMDVSTHAEVLRALESLHGFKPFKPLRGKASKKKALTTAG